MKDHAEIFNSFHTLYSSPAASVVFVASLSSFEEVGVDVTSPELLEVLPFPLRVNRLRRFW